MTPHKESVWDYPRPPRVERSQRRVQVVLGGIEIADTVAAMRVLETSHPPTWYLQETALRDVTVTRTARTSVCEFKGPAVYLDLAAGGVVAAAAAWTYPAPTGSFGLLRGHVAIYPSRVDACTVDGEVVDAQTGDFYGGWITSDITGPFKGGPGTTGW